MRLKLQYTRDTGKKTTSLVIDTTDHSKVHGLIVAEEDVEDFINEYGDIQIAHPDYVSWLEEKVEELTEKVEG